MQASDLNILIYLDWESGDDSGKIVNYHIKLSSKKYNIQYELFWCPKLTIGIQNINNRTLTNMLKKIENQDKDDDNDFQFGRG